MEKPDIFHQAIERFIEENANIHQQLITAYENNNNDKLVELAHKIRGISGNLRLEQLYELSSQIENRTLKNERLHTERYIHAIPSALADIKGYLEKSNKQPADNEPANNFLEALNALQEASKNNQVDAKQLALASQHITKKEAKTLKKYADNFDFSKLSENLKQLQEKYHSLNPITEETVE